MFLSGSGEETLDDPGNRGCYVPLILKLGPRDAQRLLAAYGPIAAHCRLRAISSLRQRTVQKYVNGSGSGMR
jgi:hypothetical protein